MLGGAGRSRLPAVGTKAAKGSTCNQNASNSKNPPCAVDEARLNDQSLINRRSELTTVTLSIQWHS
jgi:hypothetical protein